MIWNNPYIKAGAGGVLKSGADQGGGGGVAPELELLNIDPVSPFDAVVVATVVGIVAGEVVA
jgi:hypothetical protein